jgi:hypothetical protein
MKLQKVTISDSNTRTVEATNQTVNKNFLGINYQFSRDLTLNLEGGKGDQIFCRATSVTSIKVEKLAVGYVQAAIRYAFLRTRSMNYAFDLGYRKNLGFSSDYYTSGAGWGYQGSLGVEQKLGRTILMGALTYSKDFFPVQIVDFERSELGLSLGLKYRFGE